MSAAIVWFRNDLRLADNPALQSALRAGLAPVPVYIHAPAEEGAWRPGAASDAWRHRSLMALDADLRRLGSRLHVFSGPSRATLEAIASATGAEAVFWNRRYEPDVQARDEAVRRGLRSRGLRVDSHNGSLLFEPWQVQTRAGDPYRVFTPFWRAAQSQWHVSKPAPAPTRLPASPPIAGEVPLAALGLAPDRGWDEPFWKEWTPGEQGADAALQAFASDGLEKYAEGRDRPDVRGTSRLSPHLHFGELAPWRVATVAAADAAGGDAFLRQLGWREFAHHVLHHFPGSADRNFNPRFDDFPWAQVKAPVLRAWRRGRTGVPILDAGMRELWATGWMHNRVRMLVASFLTKNLGIHWRHGARWFWDTLVDADLANNSLGWQWVAGTGADAAPYYRVFNPTLQARRFDPDGHYVARWLPGFAALPVVLRHEPWRDPHRVRAVAGPDYPDRPMVDPAASRKAALEAFAQSRDR